MAAPEPQPENALLAALSRSGSENALLNALARHQATQRGAASLAEIARSREEVQRVTGMPLLTVAKQTAREARPRATAPVRVPSLRTSLPTKGVDTRSLAETTRAADGIAAMAERLESMQTLLAEGFNTLADRNEEVAKREQNQDAREASRSRRELLGTIGILIGIVTGAPTIASIVGWFIGLF